MSCERCAKLEEALKLLLEIRRPKAQIPDKELSELMILSETVPPGNFVELGVYKGGSAWFLNQSTKKLVLHLFDTFSGIPEATSTDVFKVGDFADTNVEDIKRFFPDAVFHVGIFPSTMPIGLDNLSFVHIDCDQYETCKSAIEEFWPRMISGGVIVFDDYPFPGIQKAIHDYFTIEKVEFTESKIPFIRKP